MRFVTEVAEFNPRQALSVAETYTASFAAYDTAECDRFVDKQLTETRNGNISKTSPCTLLYWNSEAYLWGGLRGLQSPEIVEYCL